MKSSSILVALVLLAIGATTVVAAEQAPSPLGRTIDSFTLQDYRGQTWSLEELNGKTRAAIVFVCVECPTAGQYAERLQVLAHKYATAGVAFVAIDANQQDSLTELAHFARAHKLEFPVLKDPGNKI